MQRVIDYILSCISKSDFNALQNFWSHMTKRFFSRLNHDLIATTHRMETNVLRLFLVNAHRNSKHEEIKQFFERMAPMLQDKRDWKEWFGEVKLLPDGEVLDSFPPSPSSLLSLPIHPSPPPPPSFPLSLSIFPSFLPPPALPFTKNAEQHPTFKLYYSREWYDTFLVSIHNFFSTMFSALRILLTTDQYLQMSFATMHVNVTLHTSYS